MKILHAVLSQDFYGSERYCAELATEQAQAGHDVEVIVHNFWSACARGLRQAVALANTFGTGNLRLTTIPRWAPAPLHGSFARRMLARFAPDIVHTHLDAAARHVGREAQTLGIPHVATLHLAYDAREVGACDGLICVADWQRPTVTGFAGEIAVVRNWLPAALAAELAKDNTAAADALRAGWQADMRTFVFGSVGRFAPEKGMDRLVGAFRTAFAHTNAAVRLAIVGDGPQRKAVEALAEGDPRIFFAGAQDETAAYYAAFDCYVSAARTEPFGRAILEAMAAGCPLVLTRTQGPSEFVRGEHVRWADDEAAIATQLAAAVERGWERDSYDVKSFSQTHAAEEIEAFYRRVLARKKATAHSRDSGNPGV